MRSFHPALAACFCSVALALALAAPAPVDAQAWAGRGRLQGEVKDEQGKPIEGAKITLRPGTDRVDANTPGPPSLTTNKNGKWSTLGLRQGAWGVLIEKEGFMVSEGQVHVDEFSPAKPIVITLKVAPKVVQEPTKGSLAVEAIGRGNDLLTQEKYADARAEYQKALDLLDDANKPAVLRGIARTYFQEGNAAKAVETLETALTLAPDDSETLRLIVTLLVAQGREDEAQKYMAKLPAGTTVDPNTLLNIGIKAYNAGKLDEALVEFDRVVRENPTLPDAYYFRGLSYLGQGKNAEAKADFLKVIELDPQGPHAADCREFVKSL